MAKKITKAQLAVLQQQKEQTMAELEHMREALRTEIEMEDIDQAASELMERDTIQTMILTLEQKLEDIQHAIARAETTGYGICEVCGNAIDPERLEIFPETTMCISCKREMEQRTVRM